MLRLVLGLDLFEPLDGVFRGVVVHHLVVTGAQQEQVAEAVTLLFGLGGVVAGAARVLSPDVADLADDALGRYELAATGGRIRLVELGDERVEDLDQLVLGLAQRDRGDQTGVVVAPLVIALRLVAIDFISLTIRDPTLV